MTKEQEAQQAQTIERWSHSGYEEMTPYDDGVYVLYDDHKAIVDSQSQKIAELTARTNGGCMSYAKNFQTVEEVKPDYAVAGQPVYIHAADVAKLFRLHFQLMNENEYGDIDAGHRLIMFRKKLIEWESL